MNKEQAVKAFRMRVPVMMINRAGQGERRDIEYDCISAVILRYAKAGYECIELELMEKKANSVTVTKPEYVYLKGEKQPPWPQECSENIRFRCGKYKNVLLSQWELDKLERIFPDTYKQCINGVSEDISADGTLYKNHYGEIVRRLLKEGD